MIDNLEQKQEGIEKIKQNLCNSPTMKKELRATRLPSAGMVSANIDKTSARYFCKQMKVI